MDISDAAKNLNCLVSGGHRPPRQGCARRGLSASIPNILTQSGAGVKCLGEGFDWYDAHDWSSP